MLDLAAPEECGRRPGNEFARLGRRGVNVILVH